MAGAGEEVPTEVLDIILDRLSARTLVACAAVSRDWQRVAFLAERWEGRLAAFLEGQVFVGDEVSQQPSPLRRYFLAVRDATRRHISAAELTGRGKSAESARS